MELAAEARKSWVWVWVVVAAESWRMSCIFFVIRTTIEEERSGIMFLRKMKETNEIQVLSIATVQPKIGALKFKCILFCLF